MFIEPLKREYRNSHHFGAS